MAHREHLCQLLESHQPNDLREQRHREAMLELLTREGCMNRDHFDPGHFTASAFVLSPTADELLLILHAKLGRWLQPGGHVEPSDEDLLAAAQREVSEEAGIAELVLEREGALDVDVHEIPAGRDPAHQHFDVRFLFRAYDTLVVPSSDAVAARWVALSDVASLCSDESVMRAVRRLR